MLACDNVKGGEYMVKDLGVLNALLLEDYICDT